MTNLLKEATVNYTVTQEVIDRMNPMQRERLEICIMCDQLNRRSHGPITTDYCKACGCVLRAKARMPYFHCPLGKW